METSPSICRAYQWTGFYITGNSVMKELREELVQRHLFSDKFPSLFLQLPLTEISQTLE